jgi:LuxR family maltose regulon positive regulatory protein
MPFGEHGSDILPLLEKARANFDKERMDSLISLAKRQVAGVKSILSAGSMKHILTNRQREIALLARDGLATKEIASRLFITENTVNSALKIVYDKLRIHSKFELKGLKF